MTNTWTGDATQPTRSESWFSTTSPDVAIHIGQTSFILTPAPAAGSFEQLRTHRVSDLLRADHYRRHHL